MLIRAKTSNYFTTKRNGDENLVTMSTVLNGGNMNTSNDVSTKKRQLEFYIIKERVHAQIIVNGL